MEYLKIIIPILVGALIGYCTNYIAIKMLFRPRKPVFVFGKKLPFTPGVIPKNQPRIASAVGKAVGQNLFTNDDIVAAITGSDLKEHLFEKIKETVFDNDSSLKDYITEYSLKKENENVAENKNEVSKNTEYETEDYENIIEEAEYKSDYDRLKDRVSDVITSKIINAFEKVDLNALVSQIAGKTLAEKVKGTMMEMFLNESTISTMSAPIGNALAEYIKNHGEEFIHPLVDAEVISFMENTINENLSELGLDTDILESVFEKIFDTVISKGGDIISEYIDIQKIVEDKINDMEVSELEDLVMQVMKNELQTIVNLGALIGAVIGVINIFVAI